MKHRPKVKKKNTRKKMEKKDSLAKNQKPTPAPPKKNQCTTTENIYMGFLCGQCMYEFENCFYTYKY